MRNIKVTFNGARGEPESFTVKVNDGDDLAVSNVLIAWLSEDPDILEAGDTITFTEADPS
jgi:hypothetical protein